MGLGDLNYVERDLDPTVAPEERKRERQRKEGKEEE